MKKTKIAALLVAGLMSGSVFAGNAGESYVGGQFSRITYEESDVDELHPTALIGRIGHFATDYIAFEARLGTGLSDDDITVSGIKATLEVDSLVGLYALAHLPLGERASVYALGGFTRADGTFSAQGVSVSEEETGVSYGVGFQAKATDSLAGNVEYVSYLDKSYSVSAISVGLNYHF